MKIELLNVRIFITKNVVITDNIGNHTSEWQEYYTCYATVGNEVGKEVTDAGMVVDDSHVEFTIRWCRKVADLDSSHYRVEFNGELYNIIAVDHMNFKHKCLKLTCKKARR